MRVRKAVVLTIVFVMMPRFALPFTTGTRHLMGNTRKQRASCFSHAVKRSQRLSSVPERIQESLQTYIIPKLCQNSTLNASSNLLAQIDNGERKAQPEGPNVTFLVGVSGGCDSVGLLCGLLEVRETTPIINIHVTHFDHEQRGDDSDGDREFVVDLCLRNSLPLTCFAWSESDQAKRGACFSQAEARRWRQDIQEKLLRVLCTKTDDRQNQPGAILTAHHLDDSNESLLLKLLRGTHLSNLKGMDVMSQRNDCWYARPLLQCRKQDIIDFVTARGWEWREDKSNVSPKYRRNRVRNELIPLLEDLLGGDRDDGNAILQRRLDRVVRQSQEIREDLTPRASIYLENETLGDGTIKVPQAWGLVEKEALYVWMQRTTSYFSFSCDDLERVISQCRDFPTRDRWELNLPGQWTIIRVGRRFHMRANQESGKEPQSLELTVMKKGERCTDDSIVIRTTKHWLREHKLIYTIANGNNLPMTPPWTISSVKLNQFLRGQKVSSEERPGTPIVIAECEEGSRALVAVLVIPKSKWIVHKDYCPSNQGLEGCIQVEVALPE